MKTKTLYPAMPTDTWAGRQYTNTYTSLPVWANVALFIVGALVAYVACVM